MDALEENTIQPHIPETKKCPDCFNHLPMSATKCTACGAKVGHGTKHGLAQRPTDWRAYAVCLLSWLVLAIYVWWAFLRK